MNNIYQDIMEPWHSKFADGQAAQWPYHRSEILLEVWKRVMHQKVFLSPPVNSPNLPTL